MSNGGLGAENKTFEDLNDVWERKFKNPNLTKSKHSGSKFKTAKLGFCRFGSLELSVLEIPNLEPWVLKL